MRLHPDLQDFLSALDAESAEYLVIGGYAVGFHSRPRFTKDLDVWIGEEPANKRRVQLALERFGMPDTLVAALTSAAPDEIVWLGNVGNPVGGNIYGPVLLPLPV